MINKSTFRFAVILVCCVAYFGCDSGSELFIAKDDKSELVYEYVEVDLDLMAKLSQISEEDVADKEPQIEFYPDQQPIKRFRSYDDFYTSSDLIAENSRLTGAPILIHENLQQYLEYQYFVPSEELDLVNYQRQLIIEDTLYTLLETSYKKQHFGHSRYEELDLVVFDPFQEVGDYLSELMQQHGAQRISDLFTLRKSSIPSDPEYPCGPPDNFGFAGGLHPARSIRYTDMCVADFNYPSLRVNQNDNQYTSNAPGAVLMWNTSYSTWIRARRGIAHTQLFKYRSQNGGYFLDYISQVDLPSTLRVSVYVTVETSHGSRSASGTTHTSATIGRTGGRGTRSHHSAIIAGVSGLPNQHKID